MKVELIVHKFFTSGPQKGVVVPKRMEFDNEALARSWFDNNKIGPHSELKHPKIRILNG